MYSEGHAGLTLAIASLMMIPFGDRYETTVFIIVATALATLPDIDLSLQRKGYPIHHRGPTHSILFAIISGIAIGGILFYIYQTWLYIFVGFGAGFVGIMSHLLGDMLTYMAFKPLWPFKETEVSLGLTRASNPIVNQAMVALGIIGFVLYAAV